MATPDERRKRTWRYRLNDESVLEVSTPPRATEKQVKRRGRISLILGTLVASGLIVAVAFGDNVQNDVTAGGNDTFTSGGSSTVNYRITANNGDGQTGCNAADGSDATVTISAPLAVTATPGSRVFSACGTTQSVVFSSTTPGDYEITVGVSDSGAGTYNTNPAKFTLHVLAAPPPSDTTAPTINCTAPDQTVWYANEVIVSCTASDTSGLADPTNDASFSLTTNLGAGNESASAQTNSNQVCDAVSPTPNCATAGPYTFMVDRKAPQLSSCDPADSVWHADNVTLDCHYTDGGSGPATQDVELTTNVAAGDEDDDAAASAGGAQACDAVGNCADSPGDISGNMIDRKAPTITCDSPAPTFVLNQSSAYVTGVAVDGGSGPASQNVSAAADTSSVLNNPKSVDLNASDNVGNNATKSCSYSVIYNWNGFFSPVENPTAWNSAKAGQSIPVKFSLGGDQGLNIFASGYPKIFSIACPNGGSTPDPIEEYATTTANSKLIYDALASQYNYVWKTDKAWAGKCFRLDVKLNDDTTHSANFLFTK